MCGVFGIWGAENPAEYVYFALHNLQHRGQESCGIVTASKRKFHEHKGMGLVSEVFTQEILEKLKGKGAIGHNRYSTSGGSSISNAQPFLADTKNGTIAIAHNGQFADYKEVRKRLQDIGCIFKTSSDSEIILHNFAYCNAKTIDDAIFETFKNIKPSYSILILTKNELIGLRDPAGVRPLVIGKIDNAFALASETVAFDIIGAEHIGEVNPGEMVVIDDRGLRRKQIFKPTKEQKCIFEYIYFSRPDSFLFGSGITISEVRKEFGREIYREHPVGADVVISVPDSSNDAALGFSEESGIPFSFGLVRSHYVNRTFIEPTQKGRDVKVRIKFNVNKSVVQGKSVVVVDDSIVRGTTSRRLVKLLKMAGAKEVHMRISSPPYKNSCYLGIDTAETKKLIASKMTIDKIRDYIGADSLLYLSRKGMLANKYLKGEFCTYCFDNAEKIKRN